MAKNRQARPRDRKQTKIEPCQPPVRPARCLYLDALRGFALLWMLAFHFCFDLIHHGLLKGNFYEDPFWTMQRTGILSLFLFCAGAGQSLAGAHGQTWQHFWRRWLQIVASALLVSIGSAFLFGDRFIYFGVLHAIAVMLIATRLALPLGQWLWPLGALAILLPIWIQDPVFDPRALNWIGLVTTKPLTEDYVPLLPWIGVMWWGTAAMQYLRQRYPATLLANPRHRLLTGLALPGRWTLTLYLLHQPLLLGALFLYLQLGNRT